MVPSRLSQPAPHQNAKENQQLWMVCGLYSSQAHCENTPMQYTAIFHGRKNDNFQMKNCDIFNIFAQKIDRGYTLEPPQ